MIKTLRLQQFKAFEDTGNIAIKPITVLAGPNSGGKSSILQSLLLLNQTLDAPPEIDLSLDGKFLQFSSLSDLSFGKPPLAKATLSMTFGLDTVLPKPIIHRYFPSLTLPNSSEMSPYSSQIDLSFRYRKRDGRTAVVVDRFDVSSHMGGVEGPRITGILKGGRYRVSLKGEGTELPDPYTGSEN